ncbi:hypothetical protein ACIHCQ_27570 [Streptomyces sp. NPDC052236]|uniref:hypothetical protein n=1 Tax=Streptomyces sp. NPDC052236 TaxID=3365686 RepID=UPI0037D664ED
MKATAHDATVLGMAGTVVYRLARSEDGEALARLDGSFHNGFRVRSGHDGRGFQDL